MFNRRMLIAVAACLAVSASSAFAGGNGGSKKDSTIHVENQTEYRLYVFADVSDARIQRAAASADPLAAFKGLGGKEVESTGTASFQVKSGNHNITAVAVDAEEGQQLVAKLRPYVGKGATMTVVIGEDDLVDLNQSSF